ncbi:MAG: hypothetical protein R2806_12400 [Saprospiraceae bacterium]
MAKTRIINIIDKLTKINYGIWNAAINTSDILYKDYEIVTELWSFYVEYDLNINYNIAKYIQTNKVKDIINLFQLNIEKDIIITHGSWRKPTKLGYQLRLLGFHWIYVPHGMLEPWSIKQKMFKKKLYFHLFEKYYVSKASYIRAVGEKEMNHLKILFPNLCKRIICISNGVPVDTEITKEYNFPIKILFLGRLHNKKVHQN